jgi:hypothetical protein
MSALNIIDLQQSVENIQKELRRTQFEKVIPMDSIQFKNENGEFDGAKYAAEIDKRSSGNLNIEEVSDLWQTRIENERYHYQQSMQQQLRH